MRSQSHARIGLLGAAALVVGLSAAWVNAQAQQQRRNAVALDADDIGGAVTSAKGPEAGVWVIAETTSLPTKLTKIVVTDDQGRYVLPDLPRGTYKVWVRGYGLVDSASVQAAPGTQLNLHAVLAADARAAAEYYPASYWWALMQAPPASEFPGTGPQGNGIPTNMASQEQWLIAMKGCSACHQIGSKITREISSALGTFPSSVAAWDRRLQVGQSGTPMNAIVNGLGRDRALRMFADWSDRIAAGELPTEAPLRPRGVERNLVITMWDWGGPEGWGVVYDAVASDKRDPRVNANGLVVGNGDGKGTMVTLDPARHTVREVKVPSIDPNPNWPGNLGPMQMLFPSPYYGDRLTWSPISPHDMAMDEKGRVWVTPILRDPNRVPDHCKSTTNPYVAYFPTARSQRHVALFDPKTEQFSLFDTCFGAQRVQFGVDNDDTVYFAGGGNVIGWINTRAYDDRRDPMAAQGWCPLVLDTNGDGRITRDWTDPDQAIDPAKDHRIDFACYGNHVNPVDGTTWCAQPQFGRGIVRLDRGPNPPQSCKAELYVPPPDKQLGRGVDFDSDGLAWFSLAGTGQFASFDRRRCKVLNGPTATGQHCPEGWTFYESTTPRFKGSNIPADWLYMGAIVDRFDTLGLGKDVPLTTSPNNDGLLALDPRTRQWLTLRVPYPMNFFPRGYNGRIDNPAAGWKGRGLWTADATIPPWHMEGGKDTLNKAVKLQIRPNPLAK